MMDCASGCMPPPPAPCSTRARISMGMLSANPQNMEAAVKSRMEMISRRLRPMRREIHPDAGNMMALATR